MPTPAGVGLSPSGMVETLQTGFGLRGAVDNSGGDQLSSLYECWSSHRQPCGAASLLSTLQWAVLEISFPKSPTDLMVSGPLSASDASAVPWGCGAFWSLLGSAMSALSCSGDVMARPRKVQGLCPHRPLGIPTCETLLLQKLMFLHREFMMS